MLLMDPSDHGTYFALLEELESGERIGVVAPLDPVRLPDSGKMRENCEHLSLVHRPLERGCEVGSSMVLDFGREAKPRT